MSNDHPKGLNELISKGFQSLGIDNIKQQANFEENKLPIALKDTLASIELITTGSKDDALIKKVHNEHKPPTETRCNIDLKDTFINKQHDNTDDDENAEKIKNDIPKDDIDPNLMEIITAEKIFQGLLKEIKRRAVSNECDMMECCQYSTYSNNTSCVW